MSYQTSPIGFEQPVCPLLRPMIFIKDQYKEQMSCSKLISCRDLFESSGHAGLIFWVVFYMRPSFIRINKQQPIEWLGVTVCFCFRSKLAAAILGGVDKVHIEPGKKVLYLGAASGTSVSHVSDICGPVSQLENHCYSFF